MSLDKRMVDRTRNL